MLNIRQAVVCLGWNLRASLKSPRTYLGLMLGFLLCWMMTNETISLSAQYHTNVQIVEPFLWSFSDADSILYASLILLLMLADFPVLTHAASYLICRTNRVSWIVGQVLTVLAITLAYSLYLLGASVLLSLGNTMSANVWSDTALMLSYAPQGFSKAFEISRKVVKLTLPYNSLAHVFSLLFSYVLLLSCVQLSATVLRSRRAGIGVALVISLVGFLLTPDRFMGWLALSSDFQYVANVVSAWVSPLQHATYAMHSLGHDLLPSLGASYALMGSISALLIALSLWRMKNYQFLFMGAEG